MNSPTVSVLVPAYNTATFIVECMDSVFAQTFRDFEVIVVNDGSPDTLELEAALEAYANRIVYIKQENTGLAGARNTALAVAKGRYIALLDSDDRWSREYLAVHVAMLEADTAVDIVFPDARIFGDTPDAGKTYMELNPLLGEITFERLIRRECYVWGGVTARRDTLDRVGAFDSNLRSAEDLDLWLRILLRGGRISYHRHVLAEYRIRSTSLSANTLEMYNQLLRLYDKLQQQFALSPSQRDAVAMQSLMVRAEQTFAKGKAAFLRADFAAAVAQIAEANLVLGSRKTRLALSLMRVAPSLLLRAYHVNCKLRTRFRA